MSVLVYLESENGKFKKAALEVASYGRAVADATNSTLTAAGFNLSSAAVLENYGVDKVLNINCTSPFKASNYANYLMHVAKKENSNIVILSSSTNSRYLAPLLAVKLEAAYVSNVIDTPLEYNPLKVKRTAFTNKAFSLSEILTETKIISVSNNAYGLKEIKGNAVMEDFNTDITESNVQINNTDKATNKVSIADAEIVVSAGRGLKGPENWSMVEDLAEVLGAATACSKPVSDLGWRPHSEHVGQTGKPVASNLYIAIGISGAIQHLAGVNSCKVKVVINTDPEAPFFKAADYGVVGDAFEVVPELIEKLKTFKAQNS